LNKHNGDDAPQNCYRPPWSLILTPSDSISLDPLKSTWFAVVADREQLVTTWLQTLDMSSMPWYKPCYLSGTNA